MMSSAPRERGQGETDQRGIQEEIPASETASLPHSFLRPLSHASKAVWPSVSDLLVGNPAFRAGSWLFAHA